MTGSNFQALAATKDERDSRAKVFKRHFFIKVILRPSLLFFLAVAVVMLLFFCSRSGAAATSGEIQEWLQVHNNYRSLHGVPPVTWSEALAANAQSYANNCPTTHSSGAGYGENLAFASFDMDERAVVEMWYEEERDYDYSNPGFSPGTGHFTQLVWKGTTAIGCGLVTGCSGKWPNIWVCQYRPHGNVYGQFEKNVFPSVSNEKKE